MGEHDINLEEYAEGDRQQEEQDKREKNLLRDYHETFKTPHGNRVLNDLLSQCLVFQSTYRKNSESFYLEGKRSVGLYLFQMVEVTNLATLRDFVLQSIKLNPPNDVGE